MEAVEEVHEGLVHGISRHIGNDSREASISPCAAQQCIPRRPLRAQDSSDFRMWHHALAAADAQLVGWFELGACSIFLVLLIAAPPKILLSQATDFLASKVLHQQPKE